VKALANAAADTTTVKGDLDALLNAYDGASITGRLTGPKAQELDTLHERIMGALGRAAANGRLAAYDIALAKQQLPVPSSIKGALLPNNIHAAVKTIKDRLDAGYISMARAHNFDVEGPGAPTDKGDRPPVAGAVKTKSGRWAAPNAKGQLEYVGG
jgi:hypothetical protein